MNNDTAFLTIPRCGRPKVPASMRVRNFDEIYDGMSQTSLKLQAERCMDCGTPYCHSHGCPLGNLVPEFNEAVHRGLWKDASALLHSTNNFPEFTGRLCPAPCESACTLNLDSEAVHICLNECSIVDRAWAEGWIHPQPPEVETGHRVAIVGSGPAGLAAAQQLRRAGHDVTVFEKSPHSGGLLRYGIPNFKLSKRVIDRRLEQMWSEGVAFECGVNIGVDISVEYLRRSFDAVVVCVGSSIARELPVEGRDLSGVHQAMDLLVAQNVALENDAETDLSAAGKNVVVIGGGDTGADCLGTALRQGARSVTQIEILPKPPADCDPTHPWPEWPTILRTNASHDEGGRRLWSIMTTGFAGKGGTLTHLNCVEVSWESGSPQPVAGTEFEIPAELSLLAMGFTKPDPSGLIEHLHLECDGRGNILCDDEQRTHVAGVYAAGDANTGAWLVVHAIAAGRRAARAVDLDLMHESALPTTPPRENR